MDRRPLYVSLTLFACSAMCHSATATPTRQIRLGYSVEHRPIVATQIGDGTPVTLILGGMHGDEPAGAYVVETLARYLKSHSLPKGDEVVLVPRVNPDGLARRTRDNAHRVDINRNFPTPDWGRHSQHGRFDPGPHPASEPATRIVMRLIAKLHPRLIITVHDPFHQLNIDGPAWRFARMMQRFDHYRITTYIGYPTPGSLGTYAGKIRHIPTITLELPNVAGSTAWRQNKNALLATVRMR